MQSRDISAKYASNPEERQMLSRMTDLVYLCQERGDVMYSQFLTPAQQEIIARVREYEIYADISFEGGYDDAERRIAVIRPKGDVGEAPIPISAMEIYSRSDLTHRDILGAILALGIKRETVGDILDCNEPPVILVLDMMAEFLRLNFSRAGSGSVELRRKPLPDLKPVSSKTLEINSTVASMRLDAIVAEGFSVSRTQAAELIKSGKVALNWREVDSPSKEVSEGDKVSLKGKGKIYLEKIGGESRKGRTFIQIKRYI